MQKLRAQVFLEKDILSSLHGFGTPMGYKPLFLEIHVALPFQVIIPTPILLFLWRRKRMVFVRLGMLLAFALRIGTFGYGQSQAATSMGVTLFTFGGNAMIAQSCASLILPSAS
jgi:hypothetical protein